MRTLSVLTCTADQPTGIALLERWLAAQTRPPDQWVIVDDGARPASITTPGALVIRRNRERACLPASSLARNLLDGIHHLTGELVAVMEHDDYYRADHLARLEAQLEGEAALLAGEGTQRYYHVGRRMWRTFDNVGASLCQTAMRRSALPTLAAAAQRCLQRRSYGIDRDLWTRIPRARWSLEASGSVVGIKGLPGRPGLGIGHRPIVGHWHHDPDLATLRQWIGPVADVYEPFQRSGF